MSLLFFSETVKIRQAQVDKLYEGLKDLAEERRGKLDETLKLYQLQGEIDDLEQWIAEKEVVAGSQDIGQDLAQVEVHFSVLTINSIRQLSCSFFFRKGRFFATLCLKQSIPPDDIQGVTDKSGSCNLVS